MKFDPRAVSRAVIALAALGAASSALAQEASPRPAAADARLSQLARDVARAQSLRDVKNLQIVYQQYAQFGMWNEMASLFSDNAEMIYGNDVIKGREAIGRYILDKFGGGKMGLPPGGIHNQILLAPVVTLSYDGRSAQARWSEVTMLGRYGGDASWAGGMEENEYVLEGGVWKISKLHYYAQFAGPVETGSLSLTPTSPIVPYHYIPSQAGRPVPDEPGDVDRTPTKLTLPEIERHIAAMNDEDKVRNLQNVYGYYVDRKMWDDVTDLFTSDGVLEIGGVGVYSGVKNVRRALEKDGPAGLKTGEINDQLQLDVVVTIDPNGIEARARGLQLGMLTPKVGEAYWAVSTFENRYVKINGVWHIREARIFPKMKADYYQGWGKSSIVDPMPPKAFAPDRPAPASDSLQGGNAIPEFFYPNPVTGKPVTYPAGSRVIATERLTPVLTTAAAPQAAPTTAASLSNRLVDDRRKLSISKAYDAVENISSTYGYYLDDFLWDEWTDNMSREGRRVQGNGWYIGHDHLYRAMTQAHIGPASPSNPRDGIRVHMRTQPVIDVAPDGRSAKIRTRMWLYYANTKQAGAWNSGMYPNDAAVLEDGVWKIDVDEIDETYFSSASYKEGWAKPRPRRPGAGPGEGGDEGPRAPPPAAAGGPAAPSGLSRNGNPIDFPPDIPKSVMNDFRYKNFSNTNYPEIKPMWFAYRNPVSGRFPEHYCEDIKTCGQ